MLGVLDLDVVSHVSVHLKCAARGLKVHDAEVFGHGYFATN